MIKRYQNQVMKEIWSEDSKFQAYLDVELASAEVLARLGIIPQAAFIALKQNAQFDVNRIDQIEQTTKHDLIAFVEAVGEFLGDEKIWLHYGLTSTDVVDTANSLRLQKANIVIENQINRLLDVLKKQANTYQYTPCVGRTHGIHAEVMSFGLKWARWYDALKQHKSAFQEARSAIEVVKMSGAVGSFSILPPDVDVEVAKILGLNVARISTQVLPRHLHSKYIFALGQIAFLIEEIATEVRHLSRTEISEVREAFFEGQKGSSVMPHKRNPIASENMCGCARMFKGYLTTTIENQNLWHERDISHSSTERIILEDATTLLEYMLSRYTHVLDSLIVDPQKMEDNIKLTYNVVYSSRVLHRLLHINIERKLAYALVQKLAFQAFDKQEDFYTLVKNSEINQYLSIEEIKDCFDSQKYFTHVAEIYRRVGL